MTSITSEYSLTFYSQLLTTKGNKAEVKLIDFGLAKVMDDVVAKSFLGTRGYLAPEMLQRHAYDKAVDIWVLSYQNFTYR